MNARGTTRKATLGGVAFLALVALVACVRFVGLGDRGLWLDESFSALAARRGISDLIAWLRFDSGPPLYYWLLGRQIALGGASEWSLRFPSALAGVATPLVLYGFARSLWPAAIGARRAAAMVTAVLPLLVLHAQDARYYALLPLAGIGSLWTLHAFLTRPTLRSGAPYVLVTAIAMYLHNYGLLLIPAAYAWALVQQRAARELRVLAAAHAVAAIAYAPWIPVLADQLRFGATSWLAARWDPSLVLSSAHALVPGAPLPVYVPMPPGIVPGTLATALVIVVVVAAFLGLRRRPDARSIGALAAFGVTPLAIAAAVSLTDRPIYAAARADVIVLPIGILALSLALAVPRPGASGLERGSVGPDGGARTGAPADRGDRSAGGYPRVYRALGATILVLVIGLSAVQLVRYVQSDLKSADRTLAWALVRNAHDIDVVITSGLTLGPLLHYTRERGADLRFVPFPVEMRDHPGTLPRGRLVDSDALVSAFAAELGDTVEAIGRPARALVLVTDDPFGRLLGATLDGIGVTRTRAPVVSSRLAVLGTPIDVYRCEVPLPGVATDGGDR